MNFLGTILERKRGEVDRRKVETPLDSLYGSPLYARVPMSMTAALRDQPMAVIAEIKKASPSKQIIRDDFNPVALALACVSGGASALSVLTDREFFQGDIAHLRDIRAAVQLPLLRKDFIIDTYQVHEARAAGADAILLILAALDPATFVTLNRCAMDIGLETLVEVHNIRELEKIRGEPLPFVGINNRDLVTFETDMGATFRIQSALPPGTMVVSESGIRSSSELQDLARRGIHAALIGETLMKAKDPGEKLRELLAPFREGSWSE